jgi:hypothetical protein
MSGFVLATEVVRYHSTWPVVVALLSLVFNLQSLRQEYDF